jgi:hypothetical protein
VWNDREQCFVFDNETHIAVGGLPQISFNSKNDATNILRFGLSCFVNKNCCGYLFTIREKFSLAITQKDLTIRTQSNKKKYRLRKSDSEWKQLMIFWDENEVYAFYENSFLGYSHSSWESLDEVSGSVGLSSRREETCEIILR